MSTRRKCKSYNAERFNRRCAGVIITIANLGAASLLALQWWLA
jgi:hypothetical protein